MMMHWLLSHWYATSFSNMRHLYALHFKKATKDEMDKMLKQI